MKISTLLTLVPLLAVALVTLSCSSLEDRHHKKSKELHTHVGDDYLDAINDAKSISLYKVSPQLPFDFTVENKIADLSDKETKELIEILTNDDSYFLNMTKSCLFVPEYAFEIKGENSILLLVSPSCKQLKWVTGAKGEILDVDPAFDQINAIILENNF